MQKLNKHRGVISVEIALIFSLMVAPLLIFSVEIGRVFYQYNVTVKNVRVAARYLSGYSQAEIKTNLNTFQDRVTNIVQCGSTTRTNCTGFTFIPTFTPFENSKVFVVNGSNVKIDYVTVKVNFSISYFSDFFKKAPVTFNFPIQATFRQAI